MDRWAGRVALVTGASSGIGAAIARVLVQHKMKVIGCGRQVSKLQELSNQFSSENLEGVLDPVQCDVSKESEIKEMFKMIQSKYGGLDVCINNAGLMHRAQLLSGNIEAWREMLDVNVMALTIITSEAYHSMTNKGIDDGQIINICSMSGHRAVPSTDTSFYSVTKFAVKALTEGVRKELRQNKSNIRIAEISPGIVKTEFFSRAGGEQYDNKVFKTIKEPLESKDIADAVLYIMSAPPHVEVHDILVRPTQQQL